MEEAMSLEAMDTSPIRPPVVRRTPEGKAIPFDLLVREAGMPNVVTLPSMPDIRLHAGMQDFYVPSLAGRIYCVSGVSLPSDPVSRAREVLRRLAYGFNEYASREVVGRHHRDLVRRVARGTISDEDAKSARMALKRSALRIRRALEAHGSATVGELAAVTGMAQPNVSRAVAELAKSGLVDVARNGRNVVCSLKAPASPTQEEAPRFGF